MIQHFHPCATCTLNHTLQSSSFCPTLNEAYCYLWKDHCVAHFHCAIPTWCISNPIATLPSCFETFQHGPIVAIRLDPSTWLCHLVNVLYLKYTFLVKSPRSIIVWSPRWSHCWSTKIWWRHDASSLKQMPRHWLGSKLHVDGWSLEFFGSTSYMKTTVHYP